MDNMLNPCFSVWCIYSSMPKLNSGSLDLGMDESLPPNVYADVIT